LFYDFSTGEHLINDKNLLLNYKEDKITLTCTKQMGDQLVFEGYDKFHFYVNNHKNKIKKSLIP